MIIGFDMDGVLCDFDESYFWNILDNLPMDRKEVALKNYFLGRKPLLNPEMFIGEGDEFHVITGRYSSYREVTERWCRKYIPNVSSINLSGIRDIWDPLRDDTEETEYYRDYKKNKILELGVEVYFDDSPWVVEHLRKELPNVKVIHYGGLTDLLPYKKKGVY